MHRHAVRRLFFASTSAVFGDTRKGSAKPRAGCNRSRSMACAKLAAEAFVSRFRPEFRFPVLGAPLPNVVGPRSTHAPSTISSAGCAPIPARLRVLGDGAQTKPCLYVDNLVAAILLVYDKAAEPLAVYHVAGQGMTSVREIAEIVVEEMGLAGISIDYTGGATGWVGDVPIQLRQRQDPRTRFPPPLRIHRRGPPRGAENPGQGVGEPCESSCWPAAVERRMGKLARAIPKPMVRLAGKPILEYQLELARR